MTTLLTAEECLRWGVQDRDSGRCNEDGPCPDHGGPKRKRAPARPTEPASPGDLEVAEVDGCMVCERGVIVEGVLSLRCVLRDGETTRYRMQVRRKDGSIDVADMKPETMESPQHWNAWLSDKANVNGRINKLTRQALKDHLFASVANAPQTMVLKHSGWHPRLGVLVFGNGFLDANGAIRKPLDDGAGLVIDTADGGRKMDVVLDQAARSDSAMLPAVMPAEWAASPVRPEDRAAARDTLEAFLQRGYENYGNHALSIALGYMLCHVASDALHAQWHSFPHLYITGPYQTGKDTLARLAMTAMLGRSHGALKGSGNTAKEIRNALGRSSFHPLWVNELRGGPDEKYLEGFIRAGYDRQSSATTNIHQQRVEFPVLRSFLLVGETVMGGGAELSRYVEVVTRPAARPEMLPLLEEMLPMVQQAMLAIMSDHAQFRRVMVDRVASARAVFLGEGIDSRRAYGWAVVCAGMSAMLGTADAWESLPATFRLEVMRRAHTAVSRSDDSSVLTRVWDWLMPVKENLSSNHARWIWADEAFIYVAPGRLYALAGQFSRTRPPEIDLVRNELSRSPAYVNWTTRAPNKASGKTPCFQFDAVHCDVDAVFPEWVLEIAYRSTTTGQLDFQLLEAHQRTRAKMRSGEKP